MTEYSAKITTMCTHMTKINYYTILNSLDKIVSYTVMLTECNQFKYYKYVVGGGGEDIKLFLTN